jgi:hypothetical protein
MATLTTTAISLSGGNTPVAGTGMDTQLTVGSSWATGDSFTVILTDGLSAVQTQVGAGYVSGVVPDFAFTYNNKVYVLSGATTYFSALNSPQTWNDPNGLFNGYVTMSNYYGTQDNLTSIATFQGRLAFFSAYTVQLWIVDPNPANWQQAQVLTNIGTYAPLSVSSLGELDVLFLNYTGIRSLRVRETTYNAYVNDIGSPIDSLLQTDIAQSGLATTAGACSIVEPTTGRYWLFVPNTQVANGVGTIYVLSYYPSNKIIAWSTYDPSVIVAGSPVYFTPVKFITYNGLVMCLASDGNVYTFGGAAGTTYDVTTATIQVPFFDMQHPSHIKKAQAIDVDVDNGSWSIYATENWINGTLVGVANAIGQATFDQGFVPWSAEGTHFTMEATTSSASAARLSTLIMHFSLGNQPVA